MLRILVLGGVLLLLLVIGVVITTNKQEQQQESAQQPPAQVEITKTGFLPATVNVRQGTTVTWTNKDSKPHHVANNPHPEHSSLQGLNSML